MSIRARSGPLRPGRTAGVVALAVAAGLGVSGAVLPVTFASATTASTTAVNAPDDGSASPEDKALAAAKAGGRPVELEAARTELSDTWVRPDGTFSVKRYGSPVRVLRAGTWVPTDPTLVFAADGRAVPKATSVVVSFSGGGTGPLLSGVKDGRTLSLSWPKPLPKPTLSGNVATYAEVLPGVDLQLKAEVEGFSQLIVVKTPQAAANPELATLKYTMSTVGVTVTTDPETGAVKATNPAGQTVFTSPSPVMWDSTTAAPPPAAPATVTKAGLTARAVAAPEAAATSGDPGSPGAAFEQPAGAKDAQMPTTVSGNTLQITPDQALLKASDTRYPVYIDPSWAWGGRQNWTRVSQKYPKNTYWNANEVARVGYETDTGGLSRSFFQLDTGNLAGAKVLSSTFRINNVWSWSCQARPVQLWHTGAISDRTNWLNQPGKIDWLSTVNQSKGWSGSSCPGGNLEFDLTWKIQRIADAHQPSITLGLYAENEGDTFGWKKFDSKSAVLETVYNNPPRTPWGLGTNPKTDCTNGGLIGNTTVSLYAHVDDPNAGNLDAQFRVVRGGTTVVDQSVPGLKDRVSTLVVPDAQLPTGDYTWQVRAKDGMGEYSPWSETCKFSIDRTRPEKAPKISSAAFPNGDGGWPTGTAKARTPGDFTISANGVADITWYGYYTDWDPAVHSNQVAPGGSWTVPLTPPGVGPHFVHAFSQDAAGNRSDTATYLFYAARSQDRDKPGDLNGDGRNDVWSLDSNGTLITYANQGNNNFTAMSAGYQSPGAKVTFSGDWGEDGYNDLVALEYDKLDKKNKLWTYPNNGLGIATTTFGKGRQELSVYCPVADPEQGCEQGDDHWQQADQILAPGDLNGDGKPDLLVKEGKQLWAYFGERNNYLDDKGAPVLVGAGDWDKFTVITPGDLNGDGVPDLWLRNLDNGEILRSFGKNDTNGRLDLATWGEPTGRTRVGVGVTKDLYPTVGSVGDITGDGVTDLWGRQADNTMFAWYGQAWNGSVNSFSGGFTVDGVVGARIPSGTVLASGQSFTAGKAKLTMQGDGNLVVTSSAGKTLWATATGGHPGAKAQMQPDGNLVVYGADGSTVLWASGTNGKPNSYAILQDRGVLVIYNPTGQGLWTSGSQSRPDYNGDGYTDVLVRDANGDMWVYRGTGGTGTTTLGALDFVGNGWWRDYWTNVYTADLNNDGRTDIVGRTREGDLWLYPGTGGTGTNSVGAPSLIGNGWNMYVTLNFGDVDLDGRTDVIGVDAGGEMWAYPSTGGTGTSTLGARKLLGNGFWPNNWTSVKFADMNGDFKIDIVGRTDTGDVYVFPNTSSGGNISFGARYFIGNGWWNGYWEPWTTDLNNDGVSEMVGRTDKGELYDFVPEGRILVGTGWGPLDIVL
ncbi:FG-GAP-like repeat-containing protein [Kitasatospora sp. NPDC090091]|uniref:FG-GAP-like repeat-containing protein n=1 Tax=Kitasatospora sp. NPDC090091 TaxID=3364081 RepID=UPI00381B0AD1